MSALKKYTPFFASAVLMWVVLLIIYPLYQYYIDPDGTAYLTISQRYASGDLANAINGYWSPWSCWLTALLIRCGLAAIPASVVINTLGATGFLYISQSLFIRFRLERILQWLLNAALAVFLCYAIFAQSFDDLWECFFLLSALRLMLADSFRTSPAIWVVTGIAGALSYFAKAYSFPFFVLNIVVCSYFITGKNSGLWLKTTLVVVTTMLICSYPWLYALHSKYGIWTTSTAGPLNTSWYLVGHPYFKEGLTLLLPPPYSGSPYYWEDPWLVRGATPHFWNSWHLLGLQLLRIGLNLWKLLRSSLELSIFFPAVGLAALLSLRNSRLKGLFNSDLALVVYSFLLFPLGYVLINFESRYIWYMLPLSLVLAGVAIQKRCIAKVPAYLRLALSLTIFPVWQLMKMAHVGKEEHRFAKEVMNLKPASFTCRAQPGIETQKAARFAYFSGLQYYNMIDANAPVKDILDEMRRYHVTYFITFDGSDLKGDNGSTFKEVNTGNSSGLRVFTVNP